MQRWFKKRCQPFKYLFMKKHFLKIFIATVATTAFFSSCIKDTCRKTKTYTLLQPVYKNWSEVEQNIKSDNAQPIIHPGKLYIKGKYIFLNEINKGVHIIDNTNPAAPQNIAFINIPGNIDIAVKNDILYADIYTRLLTIDVANPLQSAVVKVTESVFPYRVYSNGFYADSNKIIVDWISKDTTVVEGCESPVIWGRGVFFMSDATVKSYNGAAVNVPGISGSLSKFTITNNRLYTVDNGQLKVFNIETAANPLQVNTVNTQSWNAETIFPFKDKLFVGTQTGMSIYNISNGDAPKFEGSFGHVRICDPVIADDNYAYVTLWSESRCAGNINELDVLDISNINQPSLVKSYNLKSPHGLSKDGNLLFVCDGLDGLKIYDAANVKNLQLIKHLNGMDAFEVIAYNNKAIVVAVDGLYQYDYSNVLNIKLLSKITIQK